MKGSVGSSTTIVSLRSAAKQGELRKKLWLKDKNRQIANSSNVVVYRPDETGQLIAVGTVEPTPKRSATKSKNRKKKKKNMRAKRAASAARQSPPMFQKEQLQHLRSIIQSES